MYFDNGDEKVRKPMSKVEKLTPVSIFRFGGETEEGGLQRKCDQTGSRPWIFGMDVMSGQNAQILGYCTTLDPLIDCSIDFQWYRRIS